MRIMRLDAETYADVVRRVLAMRDAGYDVSIDWPEIEGLLKEHDELRNAVPADGPKKEEIEVGDEVTFRTPVGSKGEVTQVHGDEATVVFYNGSYYAETTCTKEMLKKIKMT